MTSLPTVWQPLGTSWRRSTARRTGRRDDARRVTTRAALLRGSLGDALNDATSQQSCVKRADTNRISDGLHVFDAKERRIRGRIAGFRRRRRRSVRRIGHPDRDLRRADPDRRVGREGCSDLRPGVPTTRLRGRRTHGRENRAGGSRSRETRTQGGSKMAPRRKRRASSIVALVVALAAATSLLVAVALGQARSPRSHSRARRPST